MLVAAEQVGSNQRENKMYRDIAEALYSTYGIKRSPASIRSFWSTLARNTQIYLSTNSFVRSRPMSGSNEDVLLTAIMEVYQKRAGKRNKNGVFRHASPFIYIETAMYLSHEPKFSDKYPSSCIATRGGSASARRRAQGSSRGSASRTGVRDSSASTAGLGDSEQARGVALQRRASRARRRYPLILHQKSHQLKSPR